MTNRLVKITPEMQKDFACLSADFNPQHMDSLLARRLMFGAPVVHGIHSLMRVLEVFVAERAGRRALASLRVSFDLPIGIGDELRLSAEETSAEVKFVLERNAQRVLRGRCAFSSQESTEAFAIGAPMMPVCRTLDGPDLVGRSGEVPLGVDSERLSKLFPSLAAGFDRRQVAILLAATRLVGMDCPGMHSIFSGLKLVFAAPSGAGDSLTYRVRSWTPTLRMLQMDIICGGDGGSIDAFLRPAPIGQATMQEVMRAVVPGEFAGTTALVVGGSRGLGETAAKVLAAGGGRVVLTYAAGQADAEGVADEIVSHGFLARSLRFDVREPGLPDTPAGPFTQLYYFATPRIRPNPQRQFDVALFQELFDIYGTGLLRTLNAVRPLLADRPVLCVPSSQFIDERHLKFREYTAAKRAAEGLAAEIEGFEGRVFQPRLPRLKTDQAAALQEVQADDPLPHILEMVRAAHRLAGGRSSR